MSKFNEIYFIIVYYKGINYQYIYKFKIKK